MIPKGAYYFQVDNTVHMEVAEMAIQHNESLGVILLCNTMLPTVYGFPRTVEEWENLLKATHKKGNNGAVCCKS